MKIIPFGLAACAALTLAACSSSSPSDVEEVSITETEVVSYPEDSEQYFNNVIGDTVLFSFDSSSIDPASQRILAAQAEWLNRYQNVNAVIEGHADERGTREYNLALGARRANAAYNFLVSRGVAPNRLRTVSYGKERPIAVCSNESCWSQNRRAVTVIAGAPVS